MTTTMNKSNNATLSILCSCRVRLTEEQRKILKSAYYDHRNAATPEPLPSIGGSAIRSQTTWSVNGQLPLADITVIDLLNSRESIALTTILALQAALGVQVISRKDITEAQTSYLDYVFKIGTDG